MPVVLQLVDAHKRYGGQALLDGASCALADDQKVGLIGRNGSGKSTLCRILLDEEDLDKGEVARGRSLRLGYVKQHDPFLTGETIREFLIRDSGQPEWRCGEVAWQFQFPDAVLDRPVRELSGGWQTRAKLAALLLHDPNLLILDEPTNFLDLRTQMLLERFLQEFQGGCLIVSHDREFLKKTCSHTLEIARGQLTMYPGNVENYLANVEERQEHDRRVNATTMAKRRQLETFINKNRAKASMASQARSKAKQLERLQLIHIEGPESQVSFSFPRIEPRQGPAARTKHLAIGYPDHTVARDVHVEIEHGTRVGVVGDNGQGKTTFLRTICGSLAPVDGELTWGYGCQVGVYAQHVYSSLPENKTVMEYLEYQAAPGTNTQQIKDVAGSLLFSGEMVEKRIKVLSGGERARLVLAGLLLEKHNILILDEPGNHLDVESVEALAEALCRYEGTVIFTSHDRHFMHRVATHVIEVRAGRVASYPGDFDEYVYRVQSEIDSGLRAPHPTGPHGTGTPPPVEAAADRKVRARSDRDSQKKLKAVERKIARMDEEKRSVSEKLLAVTDAAEAQRLHTQLAKLSGELQQLEEEWLELSSELESA
ncbi:MAG: ABC-F family ATP-binding cassette domain-containing protein [Pirellulales bacterium]